jgi:hypothetical protein
MFSKVLTVEPSQTLELLPSRSVLVYHLDLRDLKLVAYSNKGREGDCGMFAAASRT